MSNIADTARATPTPKPASKRGRAAAAFFFAPVITAALFNIIAIGGFYLVTHTMPLLSGVQRSSWMVFGACLAVMLLLGWPFHALAAWRRWTRVSTYLLAGAFFGSLLTAVVVTLYPRAPNITTQAIMGTATGAGIVVLVPCFVMFAVFWLIRRPDRDPAPSPHTLFE